MIDQLESRVLLSDMTITGTTVNDKIAIRQTNTSTTSATIEVTNKGGASIPVKVGSTTTNVLAGKTTSFPGIGKIVLVDLRGGDDIYTANSSVKIAQTISGGDGKDTITGGNGDDSIGGDRSTGSFNDSIHGGAGKDTIRGFGGNDNLFGDAGMDSILGGSGRDTLEGGTDPDTLLGEDGDDIIYIMDGSVDSLDGGGGTDKSDPIATDGDIATNMEGNFVAFGSDNPDGFVFTVIGTDAADKIAASLDSNRTLIVTINGITVRYTEAQRRTFLIAANNNNFSAGMGASRIAVYGGMGNDTISAGAGIEDVFGNSGNDKLTSVDTGVLAGGPGNDQLTLNATATGFRYLVGDVDGISFVKSLSRNESGVDGNDTINGSQFAEVIDAGHGADVVRPGGGTPVNRPSGMQEKDDISCTGSTRDTLDFGSRTDALSIQLHDNGAADASGSSGDVSVVDPIPPAIIGGSGNDKITGSKLADIISGNGGNDSILGGNGNDTLNGNSGNDTINGGSDNDLLKGGSGKDTLIGSAGKDSLFGEDGNDRLDLGPGNDYAEGGNNDDLFVNLDGSKDTLKGGTGNDTASRALADMDMISEVEVLT